MASPGSRYLLIVAVMLAAPAAAVAEQPPYCGEMQRQYLAASSRSAGGTTDQIRHELAQLQAAARRSNCNRFLFFGPTPSSQCPAIMSRVNQLQRQLAANAGGLSPILSLPQEPARLRDWLVQNGCSVPERQTGVVRSLCVRTCDGYYFPIGTGSRTKVAAEACQSMYAEEGQAELFLQRREGDVARAVSLDGKRRYGDQPYAFVFQKEFIPSCQAELKVGLAALAERYLSATATISQSAAERGSGRTVTAIAPPRPRPASVGEDPETVADSGAILDDYARTSAAEGAVSPIRLVGEAYYAELFASRPKMLHRPPLGYDLLNLQAFDAAAMETPTN
jgi:hypothetical protein